MILPDFRSSVFADNFLRILGGMLAVASILFAGLMIGVGPDIISKKLVESIPDSAIRLALVTFDHGSGGDRRREVDFEAVGSIHAFGGARLLSEFELLDCDGRGARVRTPQGRILRATIHSRLPGVGEIVAIARESGRCVVSTREGRIVGR